MNLYDFTVETMEGDTKALSDFRGQVVLVVNTATACQFTPQYGELQDLYDDFEDMGFEILDFPSNQFMDQAPGDNEEIHTFCSLRYGITFPQYAKIDVNGETAIPLYKWLTANTIFHGLGGVGENVLLKMMVRSMDKDYKNNSNIKWNFTKFLIDQKGEIVGRFEPTDSIADVRAAVEKLYEDASEV